jgi:GDP/UDP-N,N'-diacetylbacillosamine 2-epimerase (hydrolysing)
MTGSRRRICYVSGTRADFGLMESTLHAIAADPRLSLTVIVTGMHLSPRHGETVAEIEAGGFAIAARVPPFSRRRRMASMFGGR